MIFPGEVFAETKEFDSKIRQLLPYYDEMLSAIALCVPSNSTRILELGCGTGELTVKVLQQCPNAQLVAVDYSPRMIDFVANKLDYQGEGDRVKTLQLDFGAWANDEADSEVGSNFDAIISSLAIHHLTDEMKGKLFQKVARSLNPNGQFWNADPLLPEFPELSDIYQQSRQRWAEKQGYDLEAVRSQIGKSDTQGYSSQDQLATLDDHLQMLNDAGFSKTAVIWKYYNLAVFGGLH
ncbi:Methyltransferase type 12 [Halothece sp. PCC 7418]|uniref:class I SAM-dependent methyltransferase n=1 Tax=Halothece sp. (strain PCC 7418) TaxID=65093 RepID=UPI0002A06AB3|nr:class I SAM-dependent methyltransferase [Halothece sp. PCC 7418]AFZ42294.1 Methyltransferase type 12 [Halothece sp. PCC 7418]